MPVNNTTNTTASDQGLVQLLANQSVEVTAQAGQTLHVSGTGAQVENVSKGAQGELIIQFTNQSSLVVKNYSQVASMQESPVIMLADGTLMKLSEIAFSTPAPDAAPVSAAATVGTTDTVAADAATHEVIAVQQPSAGQKVTLTLDGTHDYAFAFAMTDPKAVKLTGDELVITFKNGGELIIPNYGSMSHGGSAHTIRLADGSQLPIGELNDVLATATQLSEIEPAAGAAAPAGGASIGGFGFQSQFAPVPFQSLDKVGPINETALSYTAPDALPASIQGFDPINAVLNVSENFVYEDGTVALLFNILPENGNQQLTLTIEGINPAWGVDTSLSGGVYDALAGTWTISLAPGQSITTGPTLAPPANSDADMTGLVSTLVVNDVFTEETVTVTSTVNIYTDAVADIPALAVVPTAVGDEGTAIALTISTAVIDTDGSEELTSVVLTGAPAGSVFNHGTETSPGVWTLTLADLTGLTVTTPAHFSGTFMLNIVSTATEVLFSGTEFDLTNNVATNSTDILVFARPVADMPEVSALNTQVYEDGSVALSVTANLTDTDGSETLTVSIGGIAAGWTVDTTASGGTYDALTGTWTITFAQGITSFTGGPIVSPPANSDADLTGLVVTATATEPSSGSTASATTTMNVITDAVIDAPILNAGDVSGNEDTAIPLNIIGSLGADTDGSETAVLTISGVPAGAVLNHGTQTSLGVWTLTPADLTGLTLTPPSGWSGSFDLNISLTATETNLSGAEITTENNQATVTDIMTVTVGPVADQPTLTVHDAQVKEDGSVALNVSASLTDIDGSETLTVSIANINAAWGVDTTTSGGVYDALTHTWTLTLPAGVTSFTGGPIVSPPANSDADMTGLVVTATATETIGGSTASATGAVTVVTDAVIDAPVLNVANSSGTQGTAIDLNITGGIGLDTDGSEAITKIVISGVPVGGVLNHGTETSSGVWTLALADLAGLKLTPPAAFSGAINLSVAETATEVTLSGSEFDLTDNETTVTKALSVTVNPVAQTPTVGAENVVVKEDGSVQFVVHSDLHTGSPADDFLTVTIGNINPAWGVDTTASGGTYDAVLHTWTVTVPAGQSFTGGPVFSPPANSDADMTGLTITAVQTDPLTGTSATAGTTANIVTDAVIDTPVLTVTNATGDEDTAIALNITGSIGSDTDGSEAVTQIVISGLPAGASLNHGTQTVPGVWLLTPADLAGLTLTPPHDYSGTLNLTVALTATEVNLSGAEVDLTDNQTTVTLPLAVTVTPIADQPNLTVHDAQVKEDGSVALNVSASLNDIDGSEVLTVSIANINAAWGVDTTTSGGTYNAVTHVWTLTLPAGVTSFTGGPIVSPPANSDADMTGLIVTATATETIGGSTASATGNVNVVTDAVIDAPVLTVANSSGAQATAIDLNITGGIGLDTDGSEAITKIVISGVPVGGVLNHGTETSAGVWTLALADLAGLKLTPPAAFSGTINLSVAETATEVTLSGAEFDLTDNETTITKNLTVTVDAPLADTPCLTVHDAQVKEDGSVALNISANLTDTDGSEVLTVSIANINAAWGVNTTTSGGTYNAVTHVWTLTLPAGVTSFTGGPTVSPPANSDADMTGLVVTATATETVGGSTSSVTGNVNVVTDAVIDAPVLTVANSSGAQATAIDLNITGGIGLDTDGSEAITKIVISGVPVGGVLNHGTETSAGVWTLALADLAGLKLTPPASFSGTINLSVAETATEVTLSGSEFDLTDNETTITKNLTVTVDAPLADTPCLTVHDAQVKEDGSVALNISANLTDTDGSEVLTVSIANINAAWGVNTTTSGGVYDVVTHTWTLTLPAGVTSFTGGPIVSPPANSDADMTGLIVTATATETVGGSTSSITGLVTVVTDAVIDAPVLTVANSSGAQGTAISLNIAGSIGVDHDGSEAITKIVISGVPVGGVLNHGTETSAGVWTLALADLAGLKLTPPAGFSGAINLSVAETATEVTLSGAEYDLTDNQMTITKNLTVTVDSPVADKPCLSVCDAKVKEDGSVALHISANLNDTDGSETLTVSIANINAAWGVNTTTSGGVYNAATHTWTLTLPAGVTSFTGGPIVSPPANSDADMTGLIVTATATETVGGNTSSANATMKVVTDAVIDAPILNVANATGAQGTAISLNITGGLGVDHDGSEAITKIVISGVPVGGVLNHGTQTTPGVWTLALADLTGLKLTPPAGFSGTINLSVAETAKEVTLSGSEYDLTDNQMTVTKGMTVKVDAPVADKPCLDFCNAKVKEDGSVALNISAKLADTDGSETLTVSISNINAAWGVNTTISGGVYNAATHTWTLTLPAGVTSFHGGPIVSPPANSDADMTGLIVKATATETVGGSTSSASGTMKVITDAVIDAPILNVANATGAQGTAIALNITGGLGVDHDGSEAITKIVISGVPAGGVLNHGTQTSPGVWTLALADLAGLKLTPPASFSGTLNLSVAETAKEVTLSGSEYNLNDNQMTVTKSLCVKVEPACPVLIVGKNVADTDGSSTNYAVGSGHGTITGNGGRDILVGDVGGASMETQVKDYNINMILDVSGSMGDASKSTSKMALMIKAVSNLMTDFGDYQGGDIKVHFTPFSDKAAPGVSFTVTDATGLANAIYYLKHLTSGSGTNYEAAMQAGIKWLQTGDTIHGAETISYFISDGSPNHYVTSTQPNASGTMQVSMAQVLGSDGSNEVGLLQSLSSQVIGVGINIGSNISNMNLIDSSGHALNVVNPSDLDAQLAASNPLNKINGVGNDHLVGGAGDDFMFGDSLNTDALAAAHGLTTVAGTGWDVFAQLESGHSHTNAGWNRTDTVNYIASHAPALATESLGSGGVGRIGGNDILEGGFGNDVIFGQEGNDYISGNGGNDTLYGGTGADVFAFHSLTDGIDTVKDFNSLQGDKLDIHDVLTGVDLLTHSLSEFVTVTANAGNSIVKVDPTGTGHFQTVAILEGVSVDLDTLISHGNLITS
jgi:thiamine pyrophosphokinase